LRCIYGISGGLYGWGCANVTPFSFDIFGLAPGDQMENVLCCVLEPDLEIQASFAWPYLSVIDFRMQEYF